MWPRASGATWGTRVRGRPCLGREEVRRGAAGKRVHAWHSAWRAPQAALAPAGTRVAGRAPCTHAACPQRAAGAVLVRMQVHDAPLLLVCAHLSAGAQVRPPPAGRCCSELLRTHVQCTRSVTRAPARLPPSPSSPSSPSGPPSPPCPFIQPALCPAGRRRAAAQRQRGGDHAPRGLRAHRRPRHDGPRGAADECVRACVCVFGGR